MQLQLHTPSPYQHLMGCPCLQVGFLYLRYVCPPRQLWEWMGPYCDDREVRDTPMQQGQRALCCLRA